MTEDMQVRNFSPHTQATYLHQVARFACHFRQSPEALGLEEIRAYQVYLTVEKRFAPSSILTAVAALRFLDRVTLKRAWPVADFIPAPKKPRTLPIVLSRTEVQRFLATVPSLKHRTILSVCYAAGLRISEAVRLQPADIDSQRMVLRVTQGKGQKDRYVMLSPWLLELLRTWWRVGTPRAWLFPGTHAGRPIITDAVEEACLQAQRRCGIPKAGEVVSSQVIRVIDAGGLQYGPAPGGPGPGEPGPRALRAGRGGATLPLRRPAPGERAAGAQVWLFLVLALPVAAAPLAYILNDTSHRL
jgi:integrase